MDERITVSFEQLRDSGFTPFVESTSAESGSSVVADFGDDDGNSLANDFGTVDEIESEGPDQSHDYTRISGGHGEWENTAKVNKAFEAAGSPRFQEVKFKAARTVRSSDPTYREITLKQAKRIATVDWG
jgi:hypothetical protein